MDQLLIWISTYSLVGSLVGVGVGVGVGVCAAMKCLHRYTTVTLPLHYLRGVALDEVEHRGGGSRRDRAHDAKVNKGHPVTV